MAYNVFGIEKDCEQYYFKGNVTFQEIIDRMETAKTINDIAYNCERITAAEYAAESQAIETQKMNKPEYALFVDMDTNDFEYTDEKNIIQESFEKGFIRKITDKIKNCVRK